MVKSILLNKSIRFSLVFLLVLSLLFVRFFQDKLFYDPFIAFFHGKYQNMNTPNYNNIKLLISFVFRYFLNTAISISILFLLFKDFKIVKLSLFLYSFLFVILILCFFFFVEVWFIDWQIVFYIRRFLIQPLFLLLFIPAFLFQEMNTKQKND